MKVNLEGTPLLENEIVLDEIYIQFVGQKGVEYPPSDKLIRDMINLFNQMMVSQN
ncbi:MAG: hypothetical protein JW923_05355 [Spirochaetales bacterium]|nr:hypothetical protein [Spirochaetales bacterium]